MYIGLGYTQVRNKKPAAVFICIFYFRCTLAHCISPRAIWVYICVFELWQLVIPYRPPKCMILSRGMYGTRNYVRGPFFQSDRSTLASSLSDWSALCGPDAASNLHKAELSLTSYVLAEENNNQLFVVYLIIWSF